MPRKAKEVVVNGIGVSPGVVVGKAFLLFEDAVTVVERSIRATDIEHEICRLEDALIETRRQIKTIQRGLEKRAGRKDASILDAHLMVLDDRSFIEEVVEGIREDRKNVEFVVKQSSDKYAAVLASVEDDYLRERVADVKDVARRIIRNLSGAEETSLDSMSDKQIVVAVDLAPSETASMNKDLVTGFATDLGSPTSHTAVMARALEIPAIVGLHDITGRIQQDDEILIDGNRGILVINPTASTLKEYGRVAEARLDIRRGLGSLKLEPAETSDGHKIMLSANVEALDEVDSVIEYGAEGVGLFRSEYLCLSKDGIVSEEEQSRIYSEVASRLAPNPVIIRTFDFGGDKYIRGEGRPKEGNPFLGCRSIRLSLLYPEKFKEQLRAILRASQKGNVKIMFPMISNVAEIVRTKELLEEAKLELTKQNVKFNPDIETGIMIEIPAAALTADILASHVDFFSIGTNDLVQYTIAVDRINERVAYLYEPTHPAVLRLIKKTVDAGHDNNIWVGVCGEMAADPLMAPLLIGLGVDELSVVPSAVPLVKDVVRAVNMEQIQGLKDDALTCSTAVEVLNKCRKLTKKVAPELLELI